MVYLSLVTFVLALLIGACSQPISPIDSALFPYECAEEPDRNWVGVVASDYSEGIFHLYHKGEQRFSDTSLKIHSDAVLRAFEGDRCFYVVNRLGGDNIQVIDPTLGKTVREHSTGRGTNPDDVYVQKGVAYVSRHNSSTLLAMDLRDGKTLFEIDLSLYADDDGLPEMSKIHGKNDRLAVQLQRLKHDTFEPTDKSQLAVVDLTRQAVERVYDFAFTNPYSEMKQDGQGNLYQALVGNLGITGDGGIQRVDAQTFEPMEVLVTETEINGQILDFEPLNETHFLLVVSRDDGEAPQSIYMRFNRATFTKEEIRVASQFSLWSLAKLGAEYWLVDRSLAASKIHRLDSQGMDLKAPLSPQTLPPFSVAGWK